MDKEQRIAFVIAQSTAAQIHALGMAAENKQREVEGKSMAYTEREFVTLINCYRLEENDVVAYLRGDIE